MNSPASLPTEQIKSLATELYAIEQRIKVLQDSKSVIYKQAKGEFGTSTADGLKAAVGLLRLEPAFRLQKLAAMGYARDIIEIVEQLVGKPTILNQEGTPEALISTHKTQATRHSVDLSAAIETVTRTPELLPDTSFNVHRHQRAHQAAKLSMPATVLEFDVGDIPDSLRRKPVIASPKFASEYKENGSVEVVDVRIPELIICEAAASDSA